MRSMSITTISKAIVKMPYERAERYCELNDVSLIKEKRIPPYWFDGIYSIYDDIEKIKIGSLIVNENRISTVTINE